MSKKDKGIKLSPKHGVNPFIEVTKNQPYKNVMPIKVQNGTPFYPTFRYSVIKLEAAKELFRDETLVNGSRLLIEDDLYSELGLGDENE